jgi:hypothetical protein
MVVKLTDGERRQIAIETQQIEVVKVRAHAQTLQSFVQGILSEG